MPNPGLAMYAIKEILRLKYEAQLSQHQIAHSLGLSVGSVCKYLKLAQAQQLRWPLPAELSEAALAQRLGLSDDPAHDTPPALDFATILGMNPLFSGLGAEAIGALARLCQTRRLPAGQTLFVKGDPGDALYGVRRGQIRIETGTTGGERLTIEVFGAGDLFG